MASLPVSLASLSFASAKLFYSQRLGSYSDPDPSLKMIGYVMPINCLQLLGLLFSLVIIASYIQAFILLTIFLVTLSNCGLLYLNYFLNSKRKDMRNLFYSKDNNLGKKDSGFIFLTAVLTSWISPCSVWANNKKLKTKFLLLSSSTTIVMYAIFISAIVTAENFEFIYPTDNHPITRCFQNSLI